MLTDKNIDNEEEAKEQFQLIQQAFEVLSDPHERAWYDDHREAILKGGFDDDKKGFYTVYREVFNKIAAEEMDHRDDDSDSDFEFPSFGTSASNYEEVVHAFYAFWQSFSTRKSYAWMDEYDTRQAENRRVVRAMDKENKKVREKARKERNEQIRALVAFVRKRDKRVEQYRIKLAEKAKENAIKAENNRKKHLAERKKVMEEYKDPDCLKMENMEGVLKEIETQLAAEFGETSSDVEASNSEDEEEPSGFFCVACNKNFKTEKAFANHENSKKHKESVVALKNFMQEEEDQHKDDESQHSKGEEDGEPGEEDVAAISLENEVLISSEEEEVTTRKKSKKNKKKAVMEIEVSDHESDVSLDLEDVGISKKQRRRKGAHKQQAKAGSEPPVDAAAAALPEEETQAESSEIADPEKPAQTTAPKSKGKRAKAAKQSGTKPAVTEQQTLGVDTSHTCVKCKSTFQSRNKLFEHFKKTGHSVPIASNSIPSKGVGEKKKRK
ncbi:hypothetical protein B566_EDAN003890 [Ephemera danica]|nr:hypothetical protein B566_EDAN003890 [Ephemera danica]